MDRKKRERKTVTFDGDTAPPPPSLPAPQDSSVQIYGPVEDSIAPRPGGPAKVISRIHPLNLEDSVGQSRGEYTSVCVVDPTMRIERSAKLDPTDEWDSLFRIVSTFILQISIMNFDDPNTRNNRMLDSVTVKYLYRPGERNVVLPQGDTTQANIKVTQETLDSNTLGLGIQSQPLAPPSINVQAQRDSKLTYERPMRSWRKGLTYEMYPSKFKEEAPAPSFLEAIGLDGPVKKPCEPLFFRVDSKHLDNCSCRRPNKMYCRYREAIKSHHEPYACAARWTWQTEALLHLWTPDVYQVIDLPITVERKVDADEVDRILERGPRWDVGKLHRYLHFDFDIEVRVRELGHGILDQIMPSDKPAEVRVKEDYGKLMNPDTTFFCLSPCLDRMHWPRHETRDLQQEAEDQARRYGYVPRLMSDDEYVKAENARQHEQANAEAAQQQQQSPPPQFLPLPPQTCYYPPPHPMSTVDGSRSYYSSVVPSSTYRSDSYRASGGGGGGGGYRAIDYPQPWGPPAPPPLPPRPYPAMRAPPRRQYVVADDYYRRRCGGPPRDGWADDRRPGQKPRAKDGSNTQKAKKMVSSLILNLLGA